MNTRRLYLGVALAAVVVYLGALWNGFALDDLAIIGRNPLVAHASGIWRAFATSYWPPELGGRMYRPLVIATFAVDRLLDGTAWFHAVNLLWNAAAAVAVTALARRWTDDAGGLAAGLLFAVHPVHVEAVANVVGRAELMAALFVALAVYAALVRGSVVWSSFAWALGLLCKENAAVAPALIAWGWLLGVARPERRQVAWFVASWVVLGTLYGVVWVMLGHGATQYQSVAPMFVGVSPVAVRLTAVHGLADVARLLVFPLTLRADYSPDERTAVTSPFDPRFATGVVCLLLWAALLVASWKRGRRLAAFGLGWVGIALLPVANVLYPTGVYVAERTLYLPSAGFVLAVTDWLGALPRAWLRPLVGALVLLTGIRTAARVPVWRDDASVAQSVVNDSPRSYVGHTRMTGVYLDQRDPAKALAEARLAARIYQRDPWIYVTGSVAAFSLGQGGAADSLLDALERVCSGTCAVSYYRYEAAIARAHGYAVAADSLVARAERLAR